MHKLTLNVKLNISNVALVGLALSSRRVPINWSHGQLDVNSSPRVDCDNHNYNSTATIQFKELGSLRDFSSHWQLWFEFEQSS